MASSHAGGRTLNRQTAAFYSIANYSCTPQIVFGLSTLGELLKTMDIEQAMKLVYVQEQIKNRQLEYGETISPCSCLTGIGITPHICRKAVLHIVGFPAHVSPLLWDIYID
jgi:hypothetical protein